MRAALSSVRFSCNGRFLPYVGYVTIAMVSVSLCWLALAFGLTHMQNDYPKLKYVLLGGLGLMALLQRE